MFSVQRICVAIMANLSYENGKIEVRENIQVVDDCQEEIHRSRYSTSFGEIVTSNNAIFQLPLQTFHLGFKKKRLK